MVRRPPLDHPPMIPSQTYIRQRSSELWETRGDRSSGRSLDGTLKVLSWNAQSELPDPTGRATKFSNYMQKVFGRQPHDLVIMLHEATYSYLNQMLKNFWVRGNFAITNLEPPELKVEGALCEPSTASDLRLRCSRTFPVMMIPKDVAVLNCFRVPLKTMGRDALFLDIQTAVTNWPGDSKKAFRLCIAHFDQLEAYQSEEVAVISHILSISMGFGYDIVGGVVGGDMNAISKCEWKICGGGNSELRGVWGDETSCRSLVLEQNRGDLRFGKPRGKALDRRTRGERQQSHRDGFFYTGSIETGALSEAQGDAGRFGRFGRFGVGLKTSMVLQIGDNGDKRLAVYSPMQPRMIRYSNQAAAAILGYDPARPTVSNVVDEFANVHPGIGVVIRATKYGVRNEGPRESTAFNNGIGFIV